MVWNKVTPFSQGVAIALFVGVFTLGFYLGVETGDFHMSVEQNHAADTGNLDSMPGHGHMNGAPAIIAAAHYMCAAGKSIDAKYLREQEHESVVLSLSDSREITVPQAISASGARYANEDESFVFWNKGNTAFIEENGATTFADCVSR